MSDPKREKLEAEAREWLDQQLGIAYEEDGVTALADLIERREREAVAEERKALREIVLRSRNDFALGGMMADKIIRALEAREKASK